MNRKFFLRGAVALIMLAGLSCVAQQNPAPTRTIVGRIYVSVDDSATIYVNGQKIHSAALNESKSGDVELAAGQRVVVLLRDKGGGRRFKMAFLSNDKQTMINFRHRDFKIPPDDIKDFTADEFKKWPKFAKEEKRKNSFPIRCYSDWLWGDTSSCTIACVITPEMITAALKQ